MSDAVSLEELKTMIPIKNDKSDDILNLIIKKTTQALIFKLGLKPGETFPEELGYIAFEVCIRRYNRRANEGMSSYTQEGESITFNSNDFDDFEGDIDDWKAANDKSSTSLGKVSFINGYRGD